MVIPGIPDIWIGREKKRETLQRDRDLEGNSVEFSDCECLHEYSPYTALVSKSDDYTASHGLINRQRGECSGSL